MREADTGPASDGNGESERQSEEGEGGREYNDGVAIIIIIRRKENQKKKQDRKEKARWRIVEEKAMDKAAPRTRAAAHNVRGLSSSTHSTNTVAVEAVDVHQHQLREGKGGEPSTTPTTSVLEKISRLASSVKTT
jgi:FKBP-type peptidyl-prolyl cis-trans isomerase